MSTRADAGSAGLTRNIRETSESGPYTHHHNRTGVSNANSRHSDGSATTKETPRSITIGPRGFCSPHRQNTRRSPSSERFRSLLGKKQRSRGSTSTEALVGKLTFADHPSASSLLCVTSLASTEDEGWRAIGVGSSSKTGHSPHRCCHTAVVQGPQHRAVAMDSHVLRLEPHRTLLGNLQAWKVLQI
jgi:hypothetical protein